MVNNLLICQMIVGSIRLKAVLNQVQIREVTIEIDIISICPS